MSDEQLEQKIDRLYEKLIAATSKEGKRMIWKQLAKALNSRSQEQIDRMQLNMNLS